MTTTVTVKANHGWPVRVTQKDPVSGDDIWGEPQIVDAGETRDFCVHSSADLVIHEIQPEEIQPNPDANPAG